MKRSAFSYLALATIAACTCVLPASAADSADEARESIKKVVATFGDTFSKLDARAFSMVFHEDADFTNVWGIRAHGRKMVEEFHRPLFEGDGLKGPPSFKRATLKMLDLKIRLIRPDVASVDVNWSMTGAILNGKDMGLRKGLLMLIITQENGAWGISVMHNMDFPVVPPVKE